MASLPWLFILLFTTLPCTVTARTVLLPFGEAEGDSAMPPSDEGTTSRISVEQNVYFMGESVYKFYVNTNGVVSINEGFPNFYPKLFPFEVEESSMIIAPFYTDVDTTNGGGDVYYRVEKRSVDNDYVFRRMERLIFASFFEIDADNLTDIFESTQMFVVTWDRVLYYSKAGRLSNTNTFQMVLLSNAKETYVIFNYDEVTWTTGYTDNAKSLPNGTGGVQGAIAKVGFNFGDGINGYMVNASATDEVIDMDVNSNTGIPGKWIFRVDQPTIRAPSESSESICFRGWKFFELEYSCFKFFDLNFDWEEADAWCRESGMEDPTSHLATVTNKEKNDFIAGDITGGVKTWVGGKFNQSHWNWVSGEPWTFENWRKREPNNWGGKEGCLNTNFVRPGKWNDHFCRNRKPFICEMTPILRPSRGGGEGS